LSGIINLGFMQLDWQFWKSHHCFSSQGQFRNFCLS